MIVRGGKEEAIGEEEERCGLEVGNAVEELRRIAN